MTFRRLELKKSQQQKYKPRRNSVVPRNPSPWVKWVVAKDYTANSAAAHGRAAIVSGDGKTEPYEGRLNSKKMEERASERTRIGTDYTATVTVTRAVQAADFLVPFVHSSFFIHPSSPPSSSVILKLHGKNGKTEPA